MNEKRNEFIDGFRGLAIIGVICTHITAWTGLFPIDGWIYKVIFGGASGVEITYFLNGYLFSNWYRENKVYEKSIGGGYRRSIKNLLRIAPVYYIGLTISIVTGTEAFDLRTVSNILFINAVHPIWFNAYGYGYVGVLVLMWLLYPLYLHRIKDTAGSLTMAFTTICLASAVYLFIYTYSPVEDISAWGNWLYYILRAIISYCMGNLAVYIEGVRNIGKKYANCITIVWFLYCFAHFCIAPFGTFELTLSILGIFILNKEDSSNLIANPVFAFFGKRSFEFFVTHLSLFLIVEKKIGMRYNQAFMAAGLFLATLVIAPVLHRLISEPWWRLVKKII